MYRTYRELYRSKTEITKIGSGDTAFKLGKYVSVGLDVILLSTVVAIFPGYFIAIILHLLYRPVAIWAWQFVIGIVAGWISKQFDPQGKSVITWTVDVISYFTRKRLTDGFNKGIKLDTKTPQYKFSFYAVDQGVASSTPIYGKGPFTLLKPLGAKVKRDGTWMLKRSHHPLDPGRYRVDDGQIKRIKEAPTLSKRKK